MPRFVSRANLLRLVLVVFVAAFVTAIYVTSSDRLGGRVPVAFAESGGVVDVQIADGSGGFVFNPIECQTMIASLSQCTSTLEVSNVGGEESSGFSYSIEAWADADGVDSENLGAFGDGLSECFIVSLASGTGVPAAGESPQSETMYGGLALGEAQPWTLRVSVNGDNGCQGASTTVIVAVFASDDESAFPNAPRTPTVTAVPVVTVEPETPTVVVPVGSPAPVFEDEEVAQAPDPTGTATPRPSSTPTALAPTATSVPPTAVPPAPTATPTPSPTPVAEVGETEGPNFLVTAIPRPGAISTDVEVIATNFTLALLALVVILVATTVFNSTLEENAVELGLIMNRFTGPTTRVGKVLGWIDLDDEDDDKPGWLASLAKPLGIVLVTASIYALLDPDFGINDETLILIVALMAGIAMSTFLYEGGQVFWSSKHYATPAAMRVYPMAIVIAVVSVLMTKFVDLHPGVIFGFVTAATIFPRGMMSSREKGMIVLVPLVGLLVTAVLAFLLIEPLHAYAEDHPGVWNALPETVAIALFVGGAQSALLILIPVTFNDGQKIWAWSKLVWLAVAVPASFMFFHVMINSGGDYGDIVEDGRAVTLLATAFVFLGVAGLTWLYFRLKNGGND